VIIVSGAARKVIEEALKLPEHERAEIAGELLVSLMSAAPPSGQHMGSLLHHSHSHIVVRPPRQGWTGLRHCADRRPRGS